MTVRHVTTADLPLLAEFWYDQMALLSQKNASWRLATDAEQQWQNWATNQLSSDDTAFFLSEIEEDTIGCVIARRVSNQVGLVPATIGQIEHLILDLHSPHKRQNAVTELLEALKVYFRQLDIQHIIVRVPSRSPVEQGFWRGLGLIHLEDTFWMDMNT